MKPAISSIMIFSILAIGISGHAAEIGHEPTAKLIYQSLCASCHGVSMDGDGPLARAVYPAPASLHHAVNEHSNMELMRTIMHGEGMMPAWFDALSHEQVWLLISYIRQEAGSSKEEH